MARRLKKKYRISFSICGILILGWIVFSLTRCVSRCATSPKETQAEKQWKHLNDTLDNQMSAVGGLDSIMERYLTRWELNGAQLAISRNDSLLYARGYGWADKEANIPMQPRHTMRIASVSKLVTAIGIMKLREMGKVGLSEHVFGPKGILNDTAYTNVIKDKRYFDITVEQLLRHKAGFTNYAGDPMFSTRYIIMQNHLATPPDHRTLLRILLKRHLGYTPGEGKRYSNLGYTLLSMIIEKRTGMSYEQFMQKYVFHPAGCYDFHIAGNYLKDRRKGEVKYYMHKGSEPVYEYNNSGQKVEKCYGENDIPRLAGAGAWTASAAELSRLVASADGIDRIPDILTKESVELMTREMPDHDFSLGWNYTVKGQPWIRTGSLSGTSAIVLKYPDGECWILITNTSTWKGHGFSKDTMALFDRLRKKYSAKLPKQDLFFYSQAR